MTVTANCEFKGSECEGHGPTEPGAALELCNVLRSCWKGGQALVLWGEPVQQGDALLLCEPRGFSVLPLLTGASPSFSSFLLENLPLNNSVQPLSAP